MQGESGDAERVVARGGVEEKEEKEIHVPKNDVEVRERLLELGEPRILFGEEPSDRRERLKNFLAKQGVSAVMDIDSDDELEDIEAEMPTETYFTQGTKDLRSARISILESSLKLARTRLDKERRQLTPAGVESKRNFDAGVLQTISKVTPVMSQFGSDRPLTSLSLHRTFVVPSGSNGGLGALATIGWSGSIAIWHPFTMEKLFSWGAHPVRAHDVVFHPQSDLPHSDSLTVSLASAGAEGALKLWTSCGKLIGICKGHSDRLCKSRFLANGAFVLSSSMDGSVRLFDVETQKGLGNMYGHPLGAYGLAVHPDGSLISSGGMDGHVRVWDLRTGESILTFSGHLQEVLSCDFAPNGISLASGSADHTIRLWDLRARSSLSVLPAHSALISTVKYHPQCSSVLVSSAFDAEIGIWGLAQQEWQQLTVQKAHESRVTSLDISSEGFIYSASFDRTWKVLAPPSTE